MGKARSTSRTRVQTDHPASTPPPSISEIVAVVPTRRRSPESDLARKHRESIVAAAADIIATVGQHRLSLGRIEKRVGMSRGQLTYYFATKEEILLAVFDHMLVRMIGEVMAAAVQPGLPRPGTGKAWNCVNHAFRHGLNRGEVKAGAELRARVHTFLAQIRQRSDYRLRIARANADWRNHLANDLALSFADQSTKAGRRGRGMSVPPLVASSIIMALFRGLTDQLAVDPDAFDPAEMADVCLCFFRTAIRPALGFGVNHEHKLGRDEWPRSSCPLLSNDQSATGTSAKTPHRFAGQQSRVCTVRRFVAALGVVRGPGTHLGWRGDSFISCGAGRQPGRDRW